MSRIEQLEERVAELEQLIKEAKAKEPTTATTEKKLAGNWAVGDEDRTIPGICTDLRLKDDGTGKAVVNGPDGRWNNMKYDLVGKELQLTEERSNSSHTLNGWLKSVSENELVLEFLVNEKMSRIRYVRE